MKWYENSWSITENLKIQWNFAKTGKYKKKLEKKLGIISNYAKFSKQF